jgi:shikimate dehydrogenase
MREGGGGSLRNVKVVVLGAGGAARAVIGSVLSLGADEVVVVNRTMDKAAGIAAAFGGRVKVAAWTELRGALAAAQVLVNATSLGMTGQAALSVDLGPMPAGALVVDIVYQPLETALLRQARERRLKTIDALGMLLHQAQPSFAAWYGVEPKVTLALRAHLIALLGER